MSSSLPSSRQEYDISTPGSSLQVYNRQEYYTSNPGSSQQVYNRQEYDISTPGSSQQVYNRQEYDIPTPGSSQPIFVLADPITVQKVLEKKTTAARALCPSRILLIYC